MNRPSFNLIDEPWIRLSRPDGTPRWCFLVAARSPGRPGLKTLGYGLSFGQVQRPVNGAVPARPRALSPVDRALHASLRRA